MKKIISLLMIVMLTLSCIPAAALYEDVPLDHKYYDDIELLTELGIIGAFANDEFLPDRNASRAEFCKMLVSVVEPPSANKNYYKDIPSDHEAIDEISYAYSMGIMIGYGNGIFDPDKEIQFGEAAKAAVELLGYGYRYDGSIEGAIILGKQLGLLKGLGNSISQPVTRAEICRLICNMIDIPIPIVKGVGKEEKYEISDDKTLLTEYRKMKMEEGVVSANEIVAIRNTSTASENQIIINNKKFWLRNKKDMDFVGLKVKYVYKIDDDADINELVYIKEKDNKTFELFRKDYVSFSNNTVYYEDEFEKIRDLKISEFADVFLNGERIPFSKTIFDDVEYGKFRFISSNNSSYYDIVYIEEFENLVIGSINNDNYSIRAFNNPAKTVELDETDKSVIIYDNKGNILTFKDLKPKQTISVVEAKKSDFVKVYVSDVSFNGTLTDIGEKDIQIGSSRYEITPGMKKEIKKYNFKSGYTWYQDFFGNIEYAVETEKEAKEYMYIIKVAPPKNDVEDTVKVKAYHIQKGMQTYEVDETFYIDDVPYKNITADDFTKKVALPVKNEEGVITEYKFQHFVMCEFNDLGKLKRVYLPKLKSDADSSYNGFTQLNKEGESLIYFSEDIYNHFGYKIVFENAAPVLMVPSDIENAYDEDWEVTSLGRFTALSAYPITAYASSADAEFADVLVSPKIKASVGDNSKISVVDKFVKSVNENGEPINKMYVYSEGKYKAVSYPDDTKASSVFLGEVYTPSDLGKGDVITYGTDDKGELNDFRIYYDISKDKFVGNGNTFNHNNRIINAYVTDISEHLLDIDVGGGEIHKFIKRPFNGFYVVKNNGNKCFVEKGSVDSAEIGDMLVIQYTSRVCYNAVLIKKIKN